MTATVAPAPALMQTYRRWPVRFTSGSGCTLVDAAGNAYLDLVAGLAVVSVGHCHPRVTRAVAEQADRLVHVSNLYDTAPAEELAHRLAVLTGGMQSFLCNSGAEAVECALKLARRHGGMRRGIVAADGGFHGRTLGALSATPQPDKQRPFEPLVPGFRAVPREDPVALLDAVDDNTAAVMIEPIQGESGIHPIPEAVLSAARDACETHGALLVFDEVQCGTGRTGFLWAWEGPAVRPDLMTVAKGFGGGLPLGACVASPRYADLFETGDHGSTFAGGPVAAAAAHAVLDVVDDDAFLAEVTAKGEALADGLAGLGLAPRGRGLMLAFDAPGARELVRRALFEQRLVLNATGPETVRLLPPLPVAADEIDEAVRRIGELL